MINYLSIGVNPPPLDTKIIVKKSAFNFDDGAEIINMNSNIWSEESAVESLIGNGFDLWALV
jgi:hypothetical protein